MYRKTIATAVAGLLILGLGACGNASDWKWTSQGDTAAMQASLLGSQDATKDFTYTKADGVSWETTAMGTTTVVKTAKQ